MSTILLLDNDKDSRQFFASVLRTTPQYQVLEVATCHEADQCLMQTVIDLVIVDSLLPDGSGIDFIERLRKTNHATRIVLFSTWLPDVKILTYLTQSLDVSLVSIKPMMCQDLARQILALAQSSPIVASAEIAHRGAMAPEQNISHLAAQLDTLRTDFSEKIPEKLKALEDTIACAKSGNTTIANAVMQAHRLHGSMGSYGYSALGTAIGSVEELLNKAQHDPTTIPSNMWKDIKNALHNAWLCLKRAPAPASSRPLTPSQSAKAILVVDDDPDFLAFAEKIGRKICVNIVAVQTIPEALQKAEFIPLCGAIIDVHMQETTSFSLSRTIRNTAENGEIPIAFASADHRIETRVASIEAGGTRFLQKPISEDNFAAIAQQFASIANADKGTVLVVGNNSDELAQYTLFLRTAGITVHALDSADGIIEKLEQIRPDMLLIDIHLTGISSIDICRALRMSDQFELLPILIITSHGVDNDALRINALQSGASDFVARPVIPEELLARVGVHLERMRLLRERADKDVLSGLLIRRAFIEAFERTLASAERDDKPVSVVLFDIDRFKRVNDDFGHLIGDQVIARLGDLLRRRFRLEDLRGRWGGEEFIVAFPGQNIIFAERVANKFLQEFAAISFVSDQGCDFHVTFTGGVAAYPEDGTSIGTLIRCADERLYKGKNNGRNQILRSDHRPERSLYYNQGAIEQN